MLDRALADIEILMVTGATVERMVNNVVACPDEVDRAIRFGEALDEDMGETSLREEPNRPLLYPSWPGWPFLEQNGSCGPGSPADKPDHLEREVCRTLWRRGLSGKSTNPRTTEYHLIRSKRLRWTLAPQKPQKQRENKEKAEEVEDAMLDLSVGTCTGPQMRTLQPRKDVLEDGDVSSHRLDISTELKHVIQ